MAKSPSNGSVAVTAKTCRRRRENGGKCRHCKGALRYKWYWMLQGEKHTILGRRIFEDWWISNIQARQTRKSLQYHHRRKHQTAVQNSPSRVDRPRKNPTEIYVRLEREIIAWDSSSTCQGMRRNSHEMDALPGFWCRKSTEGLVHWRTRTSRCGCWPWTVSEGHGTYRSTHAFIRQRWWGMWCMARTTVLCLCWRLRS